MNILTQLKTLLNDPSIEIETNIQSLWSGYGQIIRCNSKNLEKSYIVKVIAPDNKINHPRGWNTSTSHQRKLKSYQVETSFYQYYANKTDAYCKVPELISCQITDECTLLVMEDLDAAGYGERKDIATWPELSIAIRWLAYFHARFMNNSGAKLWPMGTYWHLATRQDELAAMPESDYKTHAELLNSALNNAKYQTLVHGDAKFENLCFSNTNQAVAAVDFQYVGKGAGVKDLAYLVGSCLTEDKLNAFAHLILPEYLNHLSQALVHYKVDIDFDDLSQETHRLYPVAWADFYRFLLGWNPESWKICDYMKNKAEEGLEIIKHYQHK